MALLHIETRVCPQCKRKDFKIEDLFCDSCVDRVALKPTEAEK
jgi:hypothetical protein